MNQQKRFWLVGITLSLLLAGVFTLSTSVRARNDSTEVVASNVDVANLQSLMNGSYTGFLSGPQSGDALDIAQKFIIANAPALGLTASDVSDMVVTDRYVSDDTGVTHIYFAQRYSGIEVYNGAISISVMPDGRVLFIGNRFVNGLAAQAKNNTTASLTAVQAVEKAAQHLQLTITSPLNTLSNIGGSSQEVVLSNGGISQNDIPAKLVFDASGKAVRLAWNVIIYQNDSLHWWNVRVDANTGEVLSKNDWVVNENFDTVVNSQADNSTNSNNQAPALAPAGATPAADGSAYKVFGIPVESPNHSVPASPSDGRTTINQPADLVSNPFGWHDTNNAAGAEFTTTQGNNAQAYTDTDANNSPDAGSSPSGGASLQFIFTVDFTQAPSAYRPAAVTNLFYWNNIMHDVNYRYGFNEVAGNFQSNNYGKGGTGNDYVLAEAQDGSGTNNANFATPTDGSKPRMQMYVWTAPTPDKDGDFDNGIITHEYGHGVSTRLTGGPSNSSCLNNSEQMGEGWSDWQSVILTMRTGDTSTTRRGVGTYALDQATNGVGIRPAPYTTDMAVNNYTYSNVPAAAVPHGVGFIWNTMLWEMNWGLINQYGFNQDMYRPVGGSWTALSGNQLAHQLVIDGMKLQPCSPGFVDGRNAILAADQALTGGVNKCIIWTAFAKRGLGNSASQGSSSSSTDGTAAFDLPAACQAPTSTPTVGPSPTATNTPLPSSCTTYSSSDVPKAISASGTPVVTSILNIPTSGTITDINVLNLNGTHTWINDLDFTLQSPASTSVQIMARSCSSEDNFGLNLDDEAAAGAWPCPPVGGGTYRPSNVLSSFDGQNSAGTWTLTVRDNANADGGSLNGWSLEVCTAGAGPTPTNTAVPPTATNTPVPPTATNTPVPPTATNTPVPPACNTYASSDVPKAISASGTPTITSILNVPSGGTITDVNVVNLNGTHTWINDLDFKLTSPSATTIQIMARSCSSQDNFGLNLDDEAAAGSWPCPPVGGGTYRPSVALSGFDGQNSTGTWTLTVKDNANLDGGSLNGWGIQICTSGFAPTTNNNDSVFQPVSLTRVPTQP